MTRMLTSSILTALLLAGCDNFLEPHPDAEPSVERAAPPLGFSAWPLGSGAELPPEPSVRGEAGRIEVSGAIATPVPCYDLDATVARHEDDLTLEIAATAQPVGCVAVVANWAYEASIGSLEPGSYRVRILHVHADREERGETVLEEEVQVH